MGKLKQYWVIILILLIILSGIFYWFQWRPSQIRKNCYKETKEILNAEINKDTPKTPIAYDFLYNDCLRARGLK